MIRLVVEARLNDFRHAILPRQALTVFEGDDVPGAATFTVCTTRLGEPICTCGLYILEWERAKRYGASQMTDGANA